MNISNYCFSKVILASTKIDNHGDKISMGALNDLQNLCLGRYGVISASENCNATCYISYTFIEPSSESDGTGEVAYNLYGIIIFDGSTKYGRIIRDRIKDLGNNLYDVASIGFILGSSEMLTTQPVRNILSVKEFVSFTFNVRSKESVRNQNRLNEVIKGTDVCPFCGSKPIVSVDDENISGLDEFKITIKCMNIECHVQPKTSFYDSNFSTACDMVLRHWNKRSTDCDDFKQKDSDNPYRVSKECNSGKDNKESLCLSCVNAAFDQDGCFCGAVCNHVVTKGCKSCIYYDKGDQES